MVVICFHFSNFEPLETAEAYPFSTIPVFHFSNFEPLETAYYLLKTINQWITKHIRIKKTDIVSIKNPA